MFKTQVPRFLSSRAIPIQSGERGDLAANEPRLPRSLTLPRNDNYRAQVRNWFKKLIFLATLFFTWFLTASPSKAEVLWQKTTVINRIELSPKMSVFVSAHVGGCLLDLEGFTSPWARVDFFSTEGNLKVTTIADREGVFRFRSVLAPIQTGDFCFLSYDVDQVANNPLCFPPPAPNTKTTVSGIFLSPTVSIEKALFRQNQIVAAKGRAFPETDLEVFLFETQRNRLLEFFDVIIPAALAREGPKLELKSDSQGYFSFNLPTQKSTKWRFFIGPKLESENMTAKSNLLTFQALSWWQWLLVLIVRTLYEAFKAFWSLVFRWETIVALMAISSAIVAVKLSRLKTSIKK